jgi:hypothetical protein
MMEKVCQRQELTAMDEDENGCSRLTAPVDLQDLVSSVAILMRLQQQSWPVQSQGWACHPP